MAKKAKKAKKGKKKVAAAKPTTKKFAAKKSVKRTAAKHTPAKKARAGKAKATKSHAPKPCARKAIAKAPAEKPAAVAAPPVSPAPKAITPAPKPVMPTATAPKPFVRPQRPAAPAPTPRVPPTESTTAATKPPAKHTAFPFGPPKDEIAKKIGLTKVEVPAVFRELADKGFAEAKENCERIQQTAGNEMTPIFEETYSSVAKAMADYNLRLFEIARTHTSAAFDFARTLATSKSLSEVIEFSTAHARHLFDRVSAQNKELLALAQKVAIEAAEAAQWTNRN